MRSNQGVWQFWLTAQALGDIGAPISRLRRELETQVLAFRNTPGFCQLQLLTTHLVLDRLFLDTSTNLLLMPRLPEIEPTMLSSTPSAPYELAVR